MYSREEFSKRIEDAVRRSAWIDQAKLSPVPELPDEPQLPIHVPTPASETRDEANPPRPAQGGNQATDFQEDRIDGSESGPANIAGKFRLKDDKLRLVPARERPRERMHELGPSGITTTELLAIVLGSGIAGRNVKNVADDLLKEFDGLRGLNRVSAFNMQKVEGIGSVKADMLTAAFELGRRAGQEEIESVEGGYGSHMPTGEVIAHSVAKQFTARLRDNSQEEMWIVLLDVRNQYRGKSRIYVGCCDQLVAKTGEILSRVVERNLPRYALVHNHPSGKGHPSGADISFTERLVRAGHLLDIELVDHVVLGEDLRSYVSMRQAKLVDFSATTRSNRKIMDVRSHADANLVASPKRIS